MILPKLDYCNFVWNNLAPSRYNSLERLQTKTARIVLKDSNPSHHQLWGKCWEASALTTAPSLAPSPPPPTSTNSWRKCMEISWENLYVDLGAWALKSYITYPVPCTTRPAKNTTNKWWVNQNVSKYDLLQTKQNISIFWTQKDFQFINNYMKIKTWIL